MPLRSLLNNVDYENLYKKSLNENQKLENINYKLKNEIIILEDDLNKNNVLLEIKSEHIEYFKRSLEGLEKKIKEIEDYSDRLEFKIGDLNNELKEYNPNLKPTKRKVTRDKVIEVKGMIEKGFNYRVTSKETGVSIKTVSRILNGYYNDL